MKYFTRILPISNCKECPKFLDEEEFKGCELSKIHCYELGRDWEEYLLQFCPLVFLEDVIDDSYNLGQQYSDEKKEIRKQVRESVESEEDSVEDEAKWKVSHKYMDMVKMNDKREGS